MEDLPKIPRKTEAELVSFWRWEYEEELGVAIRLDDGTELTVTFPLDSRAALDVLHLLAERVAEVVNRIGQTGVVLTRYAPPEDGDGVDDE